LFGVRDPSVQGRIRNDAALPIQYQGSWFISDNALTGLGLGLRCRPRTPKVSALGATARLKGRKAMRNWKTLLASALVASLGFGSAALAQDEPAAPPITEFPRNETLIIQNPEQPAQNPGWFNLWVLGGGHGTST